MVFNMGGKFSDNKNKNILFFFIEQCFSTCAPPNFKTSKKQSIIALFWSLPNFAESQFCILVNREPKNVKNLCNVEKDNEPFFLSLFLLFSRTKEAIQEILP
jgi:hypothetical protein